MLPLLLVESETDPSLEQLRSSARHKRRVDKSVQCVHYLRGGDKLPVVQQIAPRFVC
jgi:hypothetical protein